MVLTYWKRWLKGNAQRGLLRRQVLVKFRPVFDCLEDRFLPSTVTWIGGSGDWNTASNWSGGVLPGSYDDVVINNSGSSAISVTHSSGTHTVNSLSLSSGSLVTFTLSGGTLTVTTTVQDNGPFTLSGGTLAGATVAAGTTIKGSGGLSGVSVAGTLDAASTSGSFTITNGLTLSNAAINLGNAAGGTITLVGTNWVNNGTIQALNGGTI